MPTHDKPNTVIEFARIACGMNPTPISKSLADLESRSRPALTPQAQGERSAMQSLFAWLHLRLTGQDLATPLASRWLSHADQRGAVPLHPTEMATDYFESEFIDPNGTGRYRLSLERLD